jgi:hypothetical protein
MRFNQNFYRFPIFHVLRSAAAAQPTMHCALRAQAAQ